MVLELGHDRAGEDAWQVGAAPARPRAVNNEASSGTQAQTFRSPGQSRRACCLACGQPFVPRGCSGRSGRALAPPSPLHAASGRAGRGLSGSASGSASLIDQVRDATVLLRSTDL